MKKIILLFALAFLTQCSFAQVNTLDTLMFDISQAVTTGSYVEVPVSFLSDDSIVALDFSFKYNQVNFTCDSIIDLTTYLQELWYYNTNDSIMRFTSYSLQNIPNNTAVVMVRFNTLSGQLCGSDMNTVKGYLNGDACSIKVVNCIPNGLLEVDASHLISIYPNPANWKLYIETQEEKVSVSLIDVSGRQVIPSFNAETLKKIEINTASLSDGVYFLQTNRSNGLTKTEKIIIAH